MNFFRVRRMATLNYCNNRLTVLLIFLTVLLASCAHSPDGRLELLTPREHLELATAYELKGEVDLALERYEMAISADKKNPKARFAYANLNMKIGKFEVARKAYTKAIELDPKSGIYRNNLGWLYMETGEYEKAVGLVERALELDPERGYIYRDTLGVIFMGQKRYGLALESLEAAVASTPAVESTAFLTIYGHMVELHKARGDSEAEAEAQQWIDAIK